MSPAFKRTRFFCVINTIGMSDPTILDKNLKNRGRKMTTRGSKVKVVQGSMCVIVYQFRHRIKINVEWKMQCCTNSRNTTNNTSAVNGYNISGISSCNTSRNKYIISFTLLCCDSDTLIEEAMEV